MQTSRLEQEWTETLEQALHLVFEGQLQKGAIAERLGVSLAVLRRWIADEVFQARLMELRGRLVQELEGVAFLQKSQRLIALSQLASDARDEWEARRYLIEQKPVPGGGMVINEVLNKGAADILRGALDDIARELGERSTNVRLAATVRHEQALIVNVVDTTPREIVDAYLATARGDEGEGERVQRAIEGMVEQRVEQEETEDEQDGGLF